MECVLIYLDNKLTYLCSKAHDYDLNAEYNTEMVEIGCVTFPYIHVYYILDLFLYNSLQFIIPSLQFSECY